MNAASQNSFQEKCQQKQEIFAKNQEVNQKILEEHKKILKI